MRSLVSISLACLLVLLTSHCINAQPITWQRTYGGTNIDYGYSIVQTQDEGFIAVGLKRIGTSSLMFGMKLDRFGDTIWTKTFSSNPASGIVALSDGHFVISGSYPQDPIIKIDLNGNVLWSIYNEAGNLLSSRDSGFFVNRSGIIKKLNNEGSVIWHFDYSSYMNSAEPWDVCTFPGNEVLIIGVVHDSLPGLNRFILKVNKYGQFEFFRRFNSIYWPNSVACPDSKSLVYSSLRDRSIFLVKYNLNGNLLWSQKLDTLIPPNAATSLEDLVECNDMGFALTGWYHAGDYNYFVRVLRTDMLGNLQWKHLYGFGDADFGKCIIQTSDSGLAIIGIRENYNLGDVYIIKTDRLGYANPPVQIIIQSNNSQPEVLTIHQNFPNPFNPVTTISYDLSNSGFVTLKVYDMLGREVKTLVNQMKTAGYHNAQFNADELASGAYFYRLSVSGEAGEFVAVRKCVVVK